MSGQHRAGGAATHAGTDYQNRASAWLSVRILAEQDASPLWELPAATTLDLIRCESDQPVDDILAGLSQSGFAFIQAKHTVMLSERTDSDLAASVDQFVRQLVGGVPQGVTTQPGGRALDTVKDRLVLVTGTGSSVPVQSHLSSMLARLRGLAPGQPIAAAAQNADEQKALRVVTNHVMRSWTAVTGVPPTEGNIRTLLRLVWVHVLDVDPGESGEREAKDVLRRTVLEDPAQADLAWSALLTNAALWARGQGGADRSTLQRLLREAGLWLRTPRSFQADVDRLRICTLASLATLAEHTRILVGPMPVRIERESTQTLADAMRQGSLVVVGEPGAGKSGALHGAAQALIQEGRHVLVLAAEQLAANSLGLLRQELNLQHEVVDVLGQWMGIEPAVLVVDALDAIRTEAGAQTLRDLIASVRTLPGWHVVVSIRKFDLRHSPSLQRLFPATSAPSAGSSDPEFAAVGHLNIPLLTHDELQQVGSQSADLAALAAGAGPEMASLLLVPFNLRLAGELLGLGAGVGELTPVRTQIELLDRYWMYRVIGEDENGYGREAVLERAVEAMAATRTLRVETRVVVAQDPTASAPLKGVLHAHVLVEWQPAPGVVPDRAILTFSHHILYDYAFARLVLRGLPEGLAGRLERDPDLVIAARPSLVMHFQYEWLRDATRASFWDLVFTVLEAPGVPEIGKVVGLGVAADMASSASDLERLTARLRNTGAAGHATGEQGLRYLVQTLLATPPARGRGQDAV